MPHRPSTNSADPTYQPLETINAGDSSRRNAVAETSLSAATKTKAALVEALLIAKVVLCWLVALPVVALCFCGLAIWDHAVSAWVRVTTGQESAPAQI